MLWFGWGLPVRSLHCSPSSTATTTTPSPPPPTTGRHCNRRCL
jgi:hypothetical protein